MHEDTFEKIAELFQALNAITEKTTTMFEGGALAVPEKNWKAMNNKLGDLWSEQADIRSEFYRVVNEACPGMCPKS